MFVVIWLLAPGLLAALYFHKLLKQPLEPVSFLSSAVVFSFLIALFTAGLFYLRGRGTREWMYMFTSIAALIKYGAIALTASVAFPNIAYLLFKLLKGNKHD